MELPNGTVLVSGGSDGTNALSSTEIFTPSNFSFSPSVSLSATMLNHTATLLPNGKVMLAGETVGVVGTICTPLPWPFTQVCGPLLGAVPLTNLFQ
jgi:hypothetical protein